MTSSVEFHFQNIDYTLIDEAKDEVYVNIERIMRTKPYEGMKQPTPVGGMLGLETIMTVKYRGDLASDFTWELSSGDVTCVGITDKDGRADLPIPIFYDRPRDFDLKILINHKY